MKRIKLIILLLLQVAFCLTGKAQTKISLNECYVLAEANYPLTKQRELIAKTADYTIQNLEKGYLPQLNIIAQATYQSEVTKIPIQLPNVNAISKDQYKAYAEINQLIYDGGAIKQQKELQKANTQIEQQKLETSLYQLKEKVNQLYFGVLLLDQQIKQNDLLVSDINLGLKRVQALINNGTALKSNGDILKADLLKNNQRLIELKANRKSFINLLSLFISKDITENTILILPLPLTTNNQINRLELQIYNGQNKALDAQKKILTSKTLPKFSFFFQGGYGRPALNMLSNNFTDYYLGGLRLIWSPSNFYSLKKDRELINLNKKTVEVQRETFLFNTNLTLKQQNIELNKYQELLNTDEEIIKLRTQIKATAVAQLENGVINSSDYLREANAEDQARQDKILHQIQSLLSQYNQQNTTGNL